MNKEPDLHQPMSEKEMQEWEAAIDREIQDYLKRKRAEEEPTTAQVVLRD